jgi:hypothetical protein
MMSFSFFYFYTENDFEKHLKKSINAFQVKNNFKNILKNKL